MRIDADGLHYRELNERLHAAVAGGAREVTLEGVRGQRYIGVGLGEGVRITVNGVPGNDLAAFMNGAEIVVHGNAQDGVGNTMNAGRVVVHGGAGDVLGHSMRGGRIYVRGGAGYRTGIHMKAYRERFPVVVIGGSVRDYLGEYMAGGMLVILGLDSDERSPVGELAGTGMHGGAIFIRGKVEPDQLGREAGRGRPSDTDWEGLRAVLRDYGSCFGLDLEPLRREEFTKLAPRTTRPYGHLYAY